MTSDCIRRDGPQPTSLFAERKFEEYGVVVQVLRLNLHGGRWLRLPQLCVARADSAYAGL